MVGTCIATQTQTLSPGNLRRPRISNAFHVRTQQQTETSRGSHLQSTHPQRFLVMSEVPTTLEESHFRQRYIQQLQRWHKEEKSVLIDFVQQYTLPDDVRESWIQFIHNRTLPPSIHPHRAMISSLPSPSTRCAAALENHLQCPKARVEGPWCGTHKGGFLPFGVHPSMLGEVSVGGRIIQLHVLPLHGVSVVADLSDCSVYAAADILQQRKRPRRIGTCCLSMSGEVSIAEAPPTNSSPTYKWRPPDEEFEDEEEEEPSQ